MSNLETEMLKIGTYFINKATIRDMNAYVDRFDVLQDLFEYVFRFLEAKRKVETHMSAHVHTCTLMYTHAHTCTHMHTHAHTCTHMHTCTHEHTRTNC